MLIEWLGDAGFIPGYGEVYRGGEKELPDDIARPFIDQGKARVPIIEEDD